jgi:aryl-alcohol dehydrogenase-like predicted oxidoreductase
MPGRLLATVRPSFRTVTRLAPWLQPTFGRARRALRGKDFCPTHLRRAAEGCLRRLRRSCLDVLQLHSPPLSVIQGDDALETLERLKSEGMIRFYGVSFTSWPARISLPAGTAVSTLQIPIDIVDQAGLAEVGSWAVPRGVGIIGNQPFRKGRLRQVAARSRRTGWQGGGARSLAEAALRGVAQLSPASVVLTGTTSLPTCGRIWRLSTRPR